jgi:Na+-translocating ferredoxin:NAD+ oxidoreductase RnfC subunit
MSENFVNLIKKSGVVGAGGAGFPTHVKVNAEAEYVIVNGAECEPLLRVDQQLMVLKTREIIKALEEVRKHVGAKKAYIGLKSKYKDALKAVAQEISSYEAMEIKELGNFYPAGDEQVLVYETLGRIVPEGGIPLNVGVVVLNVETLLNIHDGVFENKPVTEKYITVTGHVRNPLTVKVPIGITIDEVIAMAGGTDLEDYIVINGGPMMGKVVESLEDPVTKTTKGLIVLPKDHSLSITFEKDMGIMLREARTACMHCSLCTEVCPRNLLGHSIEPHKLIRLASYGSICDSDTNTTTAYLCCECRLCEYACVMNLQPWKLHNMMKIEMGAAGIRNPHNNEPENVHPFREYKRYPVNKLIKQLGLSDYDRKAPLSDLDADFEKVSIQLRQHIGMPAEPLVGKGDIVEAGQIIAKIPQGKLGSEIHSSIKGKIISVDNGEIVIGHVG